MTLLISMPMFTEEPRISLANIEAFALENWTDVDAFKDATEEEGAISFTVRDSIVAIGIMPAPIPWSDLEGPCSTSCLWANAKEEISGHQYHLVVAVSSEALSSVEAAILLTQINAALLAVVQGAIGVFWSHASLLIPRDVFIEFALSVLPEGSPVPIWVDIRVGPGEQGASTGFTTGLAAFGMMEIEAIDAPESMADLKDRLTGLVDYLLQNGPVIKNGDTVGEDENERIKVVYKKSKLGHKGKVMRLNYSNGKPKRFSLKFW
ncbi:DUF4261 domain-containing protein [Hahella sp. KA22]|uniref:DUF4261 domain-containing protein n=1 Tax=Hahella sp. KA22 TaxID=1628392 RepID=UPI000FDEBB22|nr:DUF4261 domain-containing protein [Hahella sp. KA22]AZZ92699.1 DUF4261 domain-containing protein [Hahella sp. KA22]QAY56073.1 DUF4261 domain-containing protein [Hahella sp. KA22]